MALIKKEKKETLKRLSIRIEAGLLEQLNAYASHMESSRDHVIAEAVRYIIGRDKEFAQNSPQILPTNVGNIRPPTRARIRNIQGRATRNELAGTSRKCRGICEGLFHRARPRALPFPEPEASAATPLAGKTSGRRSQTSSPPRPTRESALPRSGTSRRFPRRRNRSLRQTSSRSGSGSAAGRESRADGRKGTDPKPGGRSCGTTRRGRSPRPRPHCRVRYPDTEPDILSETDWRIEEDGTESKIHIGQDQDGYYYAVERSPAQDEEDDLRWHGPYPTEDEAACAAYGGEHHVDAKISSFGEEEQAVPSIPEAQNSQVLERCPGRKPGTGGAQPMNQTALTFACAAIVGTLGLKRFLSRTGTHCCNWSCSTSPGSSTRSGGAGS